MIAGRATQRGTIAALLAPIMGLSIVAGAFDLSN